MLHTTPATNVPNFHRFGTSHGPESVQASARVVSQRSAFGHQSVPTQPARVGCCSHLCSCRFIKYDYQVISRMDPKVRAPFPGATWRYAPLSGPGGRVTPCLPVTQLAPMEPANTSARAPGAGGPGKTAGTACGITYDLETALSFHPGYPILPALWLHEQPGGPMIWIPTSLVTCEAKAIPGQQYRWRAQGLTPAGMHMVQHSLTPQSTFSDTSMKGREECWEKTLGRAERAIHTLTQRLLQGNPLGVGPEQAGVPC